MSTSYKPGDYVATALTIRTREGVAVVTRTALVLGVEANSANPADPLYRVEYVDQTAAPYGRMGHLAQSDITGPAAR